MDFKDIRNNIIIEDKYGYQLAYKIVKKSITNKYHLYIGDRLDNLENKRLRLNKYKNFFDLKQPLEDDRYILLRESYKEDLNKLLNDKDKILKQRKLIQQYTQHLTLLDKELNS